MKTDVQKIQRPSLITIAENANTAIFLVPRVEGHVLKTAFSVLLDLLGISFNRLVFLCMHALDSFMLKIQQIMCRSVTIATRLAWGAEGSREIVLCVLLSIYG